MEEYQRLNIAVIGAGIAGLTVAVALRDAGHAVTILEKSPFAGEIGAALFLSPNGARVLSTVGFSFAKAQACPALRWANLDARDLSFLNAAEFPPEGSPDAPGGAGAWTVGRVELHAELLRLASSSREPGGGGKSVKGHGGEGVKGDGGKGSVTIKLGTRVLSLSPLVTAHDGAREELSGFDLIVGADGLHSVARRSVCSQPSEPVRFPSSAFRFLVPRQTLEVDPVARRIFAHKSMPGTSLVADPDEEGDEVERHMVFYGYRGEEMYNFVGITPTNLPAHTPGATKVDFSSAVSREDTEVVRGEMLRVFAKYDPALRRCMELAPEIRIWPLTYHAPLRSMVRTEERIVLIGDAAHPMLPFGGQGSNQAIEDAGALAELLRFLPASTGSSGAESGGVTEDVLTERLKAFDGTRHPRTAAIQILSSVRVGHEGRVREALRPYFGNEEEIPADFKQRMRHHWGHDALGAAIAARERLMARGL